MTEKQVKEYVKEMKSYEKKVTASASEALNLLKRAGICTSKGNLKQIYK